MRSFRRKRENAPVTRDALAEAEILVGAGRRLEAIQLLTAGNRAERHPATEERLVQLRYEAFAELDASAGLESWPPPAPELFSGVSGIPEVTPEEFTSDTIRSGIVGHGALIVRGLIGHDRVAQLIDGIDRTFAAHDAFVDGAPVTETAPWYVPFEASPESAIGMIRPWVRKGGGVLAVESPRAMFDVLDVFADAGLGDKLAGYLGEPPVLAAKKWTLRRVPIDSGTNWHQDGAFLGADIRAVNVWLALTRCGDDAPGLDIVGRRVPDLAPTGTDGALFDWSVGEPMVARVAEGAPILRPIFQPGDAVLFDDLTLHRTAAGPDMKRERYAIESWFFAPSRYPIDQVPVTF